MSEEKWAQVAEVSQDEEAAVICDFLQSEGIEARVENRKFHMEPVNFGDLAVITVLVHDEDAARAKDLLEERGREFEKMEESGDEDSILTDSGPADVPEEGER
jgi:hypothetical protein